MTALGVSWTNCLLANFGPLLRLGPRTSNDLHPTVQNWCRLPSATRHDTSWSHNSKRNNTSQPPTLRESNRWLEKKWLEQKFVGFRMLMDLSKTQHRIREDVDFCALKIDNSFITNQSQLFPRMIFPMNCVQIVHIFLFARQFF